MERRRGGFTVVELLIVIVVIAILATLVIVGYGAVAKNARDSSVKADGKIARDAIDLYGLNNQSKYIAWFSGNSLPAGLDVKVSQGNYVDIVTSSDTKEYCIRVFNPQSSYTSASTAYTLESSPSSCATLVASDDAIAAGMPSNALASISIGDNTTCGATYGGSVYCWGNNSSGQFGINSTSLTNLSPVSAYTSNLPGGVKAKQVVASMPSFTCILGSDNKVYCAGPGAYLGNGSSTQANLPTAVSTSGVLSGKTVQSIDANYYNTCVIASDNNAYCWGTGSYGAFGDQAGSTSALTPIAVYTGGVLSGKSLTSIAAGWHHACVLATDGNAYCWGYNGSSGATGGGLGNGSTVNSNTAVATTMSGALSGKTLKSITAGRYFTCGIASDNNAYCWGMNSVGQLGTGVAGGSTTPAAVSTSGVLSGKTIKAISSGESHTCAIASDDQVYCWGSNTSGQLGTGSAGSSSNVPVLAGGALVGKKVVKITTGVGHSCAITDDGKAYCWGANSNGRLGTGSSSSSYSPTQVNL